MLKLKKIIFISAIALILAFTLQKTTNFYIERQINNHLSPYNITANLERLSRLTLKHKGLTLACKIKIEGGTLAITPEKSGIIAKLLPDKIKIPLN